LFKFSQEFKQLGLSSRGECIDSRPLTDNLGRHRRYSTKTRKTEK